MTITNDGGWMRVGDIKTPEAYVPKRITPGSMHAFLIEPNAVRRMGPGKISLRTPKKGRDSIEFKQWHLKKTPSFLSPQNSLENRTTALIELEKKLGEYGIYVAHANVRLDGSRSQTISGTFFRDRQNPSWRADFGRESIPTRVSLGPLESFGLYSHEAGDVGNVKVTIGGLVRNSRRVHFEGGHFGKGETYEFGEKADLREGRAAIFDELDVLLGRENLYIADANMDMSNRFGANTIEGTLYAAVTRSKGA